MNTRRCCSIPMRCFMSIDGSSNYFRPGLMSRRNMLRRMCGGFGMVGLAGLLGPQFLFGANGRRPLDFAPRAKRVIFLFMNGGPSHVDTFDPKPALKEFAGKQPEGELYKKSKGSGFMPSPLSFAKYGRSGIEV